MFLLTFLLLTFPFFSFATTSQMQTITLAAEIVDNFDVSEKLSTTILGPTFQPVIYNETNESFNPIFCKVSSISSKPVARFSFNVHYNKMTCVTGESENSGEVFIVIPELTIEPSGVKEVNNKISLSGAEYWNIVEFNGNSIHVSELDFKVSFPKIEQRQQEAIYCVGYIVLLSSVDI